MLREKEDTTVTNDTDYMDLTDFADSIPSLTEQPIVGEVDDIDDIIDKEAEYPGGTKALLQYLNQNLKYPKEAIDKKLQGKVMVILRSTKMVSFLISE